MKSKCVKNKKTGQVRRVKEDVAKGMTTGRNPEWVYVPKKLWKKGRGSESE